MQPPEATGLAAYAQPAEASRGRRHPEQEHPYRSLYQRLLDRYSDPEALALIEQALDRERDSAYVLSELRRELPSS